jgi:hypothetical protein
MPTYDLPVYTRTSWPRRTSSAATARIGRACPANGIAVIRIEATRRVSTDGLQAAAA